MSENKFLKWKRQMECWGVFKRPLSQPKKERELVPVPVKRLKKDK